MKTSILISGKQGSGKTFKMKELLSTYEKSVIKEISPEAFLSLSPLKMNPKWIYSVEGVVDLNQISKIDKLISQFDLKVIATTLLSRNELSSQPIKSFEFFFLT